MADNVHEDCIHCSVCGGSCTECDGDGKIATAVFDSDTCRWVPVDHPCPATVRALYGR